MLHYYITIIQSVSRSVSGDDKGAKFDDGSLDSDMEEQEASEDYVKGNKCCLEEKYLLSNDCVQVAIIQLKLETFFTSAIKS